MFTAKGSVSEIGIGLFSGDPVRLTVSGYSSKGIWFKNRFGIMQKLSPQSIFVDNHNTSVVFPDGTSVKLVEHLLAAVYAMGITSILIAVDGDEIPLFDGSSSSYITLLSELELVKNSVDEIAFLTSPVEVREGDFYVKAKPSSTLSFKSSISFPGTPIGHQSLDYAFSKESFVKEISTARTFGIVSDIELARNFYRGSTVDNTVIVSNNVLLSQLRMPDEFIRHKILDSIGDLRTFEYPLMMEYESFGSSHRLNNELLREVCRENAYEVVSVENFSLDYAVAKAKGRYFA